MPTTQPAILIVGGLNYIGRHLVNHLVTHQLASRLTVIDRTIPQISHLSPAHQALFNEVDCRQCSITTKDDIAHTLSNTKWDVVVCVAHEWRFGLSEKAYERGTIQPALASAEYARDQDALFVYVGDASRRQHALGTAAKEDAPPRVVKSGHRFNAITKVEDLLAQMQGLKLIDLRMAMVYGPDCTVGLMHTFATALLYKYTDEPFVMNVSPKLKVSSVHVTDVVRACSHVINYAFHNAVHYPLVYNLADDGDTSIKDLMDVMQAVLQVKVQWLPALMNKVLTMMFKIPGFFDDYNEKVLGEWLKLLEENNIKSTPVDIYLFPEYVEVDDVHVDNTKFKRETAFAYTHPKLTPELVKEAMNDLQDRHMLPRLK